MPTLVFSKQFLDDFASLEPSVRQKVRELPGKFEEATHTGIHLEKLSGAKDDRIRTVRVDRFWRGVVVRLGDGQYALLRVMAHDDANQWAVNQRFGVNPVTGLVEIVDIPTVERKVEQVTATAPAQAPSLFENRRDRDFTALGIDAELIPVLRKISDEGELYAIASYLPEAQADAVLMLADGMDPEDIWAELARDYDLEEGEVDTTDIETALQRSGSQSTFRVTTDDDELLELLSGDFEAWRTFLHPTQRSLAYRPVFNGPAKVTGGAGTGKTVVAIHRARYLAQQLIERGDDTSRILVATFTNSLADNLSRTLRNFCTPDEFRRLHVSTVDSFARQVLSGAKSDIRPANSRLISELASEAATMSGLDEYGLDGDFLQAEWEQVILARRLENLPAYGTSPRPGRGSRLPRQARRAVWSAIERLTGALADRNQASFLQVADLAGDLLASRPTRPYAHVIVDEAQDLHPAQWRLLRSAVAEGANDLFIVGDAHQRIYDYRVSLSSLGIETRGRSRRLRINYRTSQQILGWAMQILTGEAIDDLDGELESQVGYRSAFDGPVPNIQKFTTPAEEAEFVAAQVDEWLTEGVALSAIGIVARTRGHLEAVQAALDAAGIAWAEIGADGKKSGVAIGTMHRAKGLEFARMVVIAVNSDAVPLPFAVTPAAQDAVRHELDLRRERCLLYVACTRGRDELVVTSSGTPSRLLPSS